MPGGRLLGSHLSRIKRAALSSFAAAAAVFGVAALSAQAQTAGQASPPTPPSSSATATQAEPDLSITARVTARELLFRKVPNPKVEFPGRPRRETVWEAERENLPPEVRPGVTYRDIGITLRITSVFADIERIVAEALGEVPAADDAPPARPPSQLDVTPPTRQSPPSASTPPSTAPSPVKSSSSTTTQPRRGRQPRGGRGQ
jgi:hypothetical protein